MMKEPIYEEMTPFKCKKKIYADSSWFQNVPIFSKSNILVLSLY
jgi:hypothetical protein